MNEEMEVNEDFIPDTPIEAQEAIEKIRAMIQDPEMDEALVMAFQNKNIAQGIAMFINSVIIPSIDKLGLSPEMVMSETGVVSNIIVDMITDAIDQGFVDAEDSEMHAKIATETMTLLDRAMSEAGGDEEMPPEEMGPPMGKPPMAKPQGIPAGLGMQNG